MNFFVILIASGWTFFAGIALILSGISLCSRKAPRTQFAGRLSLLAGFLLAAVTTAPIPYGCYIAAVAATAAWAASNWFPKSAARAKSAAPWAMAAAWILAASFELPYSFNPRLTPAKTRTLTVIGDSVSAGTGDERGPTWPKLLARDRQIQVQDLSRVGETVLSAAKRLERNTITSDVVLLEIGGNDVLGSTTPAEYTAGLELLLRRAAAPGRQAAMFELPLPPFQHEYGRIQRRLAWKHRVRLIPKRAFVQAIGGPDSTLDSIHLTAAGHARMADIVWSVVGGAFP